MSRAPGRGVTCGARWPKKLLSRPAASLLITDNWWQTSTHQYLFSCRECHKYASCIMTFEGAEDLATCRFESKSQDGDRWKGWQSWHLFLLIKAMSVKTRYCTFRSFDHFHFRPTYDISRDCVLCWLKQCPWKLDIAPLDVPMGSMVMARRLVCLENLSLIRWYS